MSHITSSVRYACHPSLCHCLYTEFMLLLFCFSFSTVFMSFRCFYSFIRANVTPSKVYFCHSLVILLLRQSDCHSFTSVFMSHLKHGIYATSKTQHLQHSFVMSRLHTVFMSFLLITLSIRYLCHSFMSLLLQIFMSLLHYSTRSVQCLCHPFFMTPLLQYGIYVIPSIWQFCHFFNSVFVSHLRYVTSSTRYLCYSFVMLLIQYSICPPS